VGIPNDGASGSVAHSTLILLTRFRAGDLSAGELLFARYLKPLQQWACGRLPVSARHIHDTADLVQDAVAQTLRHIHHFEPDGPGGLHAYLRQAVTNRVRDELRKRRPDHTADLSSLPSSEPSPLDALLEREDRARYEAALARMSSADRETLIGRLELGMSYEDLAAALGKPSVNATRVAVSRAVARLARAMRDAR
jgi:RNA polymerase sigma factor (sigma-70 family)